MTQGLIFVLALLVGYVSSLQFPEKCENRNAVESFNVSQYTGSWYLIQRYENTLENEGCNVTVNFAADNTNATYLNITVHSANGDNLRGIARQEDTVSGTFNVTFYKQNTTDEYTFIVLSTNYTSYSVVWLCRDLLNGNSSQILWVFSRASNLEETDMAKVNTTLTSNHLTHALLSEVNATCTSGSSCISVLTLYLLPTLMVLIFSFIF